MAAANRMPCFLATMKWEGGDKLSLDRRDPGNWTGGKVGVGLLKGTKWGVAAAAYPTRDIAKLTADEALSIFVEHYWRPIGGDDLPAGLDHAVSDDAYNSGPGAALRRLKKVEAGGARLSVAARIQAYSRSRLSFLEGLRSWRAFGRGWARRVAGVEAESLKMALAAQPGSPLPALPAAMDRDGFLTPADIPPIRAAAITQSTIAQAVADADSAGAAARRRAAIIVVTSLAAAHWRSAFAPAWWVGLVLLAAGLLATQLWAWRVHAARRDALALLTNELGAEPTD